MRHPVALTVTLFFLALVWCVCALALDPSLDVSQYAHKSWTIREGFSKGMITSIAQTSDGYLWLGTEVGLLRFDGMRAVPWQAPSDQHLPSTYVTALLATHDGTLWIGTFMGLVSWKAGKLTMFPQLSGLLVLTLLEDHEGTVWAGGFGYTPPGKLCAIQNEKVHCYGEDGTFGNGVLGLYEDGQRRLWAGVLNGFWQWKPGPAQFHELGGQPNGIQSFAEEGDSLLLSTPQGVRRLAGGNIKVAYSYPWPASKSLSTCAACHILRDRDGAIWVGSSRGLMHRHVGRTDTFGTTDGLSGNAVTTLFEDREGSVWVATTKGLDRFRRYPVTNFSEKQGLTSEHGSVLASRDGSVWVATADRLSRWDRGQVTIYKEPGKVSGPLPTEGQDRIRSRVVSGLPVHHQTCLFQDIGGRLWVATNDGVGYLKDDGFVLISTVHGDVPYAMAGDAKGNLWISMMDHGLFHLFNDRLAEVIPWSALGRNDVATAIAVDPVHGGAWLGFSKGGLGYFKDGQISTSYTVADDLGQGRVSDLRFDHEGTLWIATQGGLSRLRHDRLLTLTTKSGLPCDTLHWIVDDGDEALWLYAVCGLIRIPRSELDGWISQENINAIKVSLFDDFDGVPLLGDEGSGPGRQPSKSPDGKIWFSSPEGLSVIDPRHLPMNKLPPPVRVETLAADGRTYDPTQGLRLPPRVEHIDIDYTALSLVAPEKNRFRFKLEGYDRDWRDVGDRRQAFYTNLPPRNYRFQVMASNNSGVWNEAGASLQFSVLPAFYQTNWFRVLCAVGFLALLWSIYQLRVQQLKQQFNIGLEARVNERTRIARELHDTLLQNFHGLMFQFQAARNLMARRPEEAMRSLDEAINETKKAIAQSRDAIQGLRSEPMAKGNLAELLTATSRQFADSNANEHSPVFDLIEEGERQTLSSTVSDEICRIALELMRNAFEHAHAQRIEVEIRYGDSTMRLRIRDDGKGIDPKVLKEGGRSGHWGLRGVRERADRIGASLDVWSEPGGGTEVQLLVPAEIAYENLPDSYRAKLVRKVKSRV